MKITRADSSPAAGPASGGARPAQPGFALPSADGAASAPSLQQTSAVSTLTSIDALIALQQTDGSVERRRRAVRRAGRLLDILDGLKLALLEGGAGDLQLRSLAQAVHESRDGALGEPGLQSLLDQIETRAAVELAKLEASA